jgi:hypothetical protein
MYVPGPTARPGVKAKAAARFRLATAPLTPFASVILVQDCCGHGAYFVSTLIFSLPVRCALLLTSSHSSPFRHSRFGSGYVPPILPHLS